MLLFISSVFQHHDYFDSAYNIGEQGFGGQPFKKI